MQQQPRMDFVVIGAMKAATSTVCEYLEYHPDVHMVPGSEPNYFNLDRNYEKGPDWYENFLDNPAPGQICGEGSNDYAARDCHPDVAERIHGYNPGMKIIYMVRQPLDRIVSAWIQVRVQGGDDVPPSLDKTVQQMPDQFVGQSRYWHNLAPFRERFAEDQIFIGFMEDLNADPDTFYGSLCDFLQISPMKLQKELRANPSAGKRVPSRLYTIINRLPFIGTIKKFLPKGLRASVKKHALSKPASARPEFSADVKRQLIAELSQDSASLLRHCGKPAGFWKFD